MNLLKYTCFLICLIFFCGAPAIADDDVSGVEGIWSPSWRSKDNLAPQWIFTKDGRVTHTFGAVVDIKYEINGSQIKSVVLSPDHSTITREEAPKDFQLEGDTLTENPRAPSRKLIMKRIGKPTTGAHPVVGEWTFKDNTGNPVYLRYANSGFAQLTIPYRTYTGTYRVDRNALLIQLQGQPPMTLNYRWEKGLLVLPDAQGKESRYLKFAN